MIKQLHQVVRLLPVLLLCVGLSAFAQEKKVSGKVTSVDDGSGVPGVNVLEKGTTNGTVTDADGNYTVSVGGSATLVFSAIGYTSQEVEVGSQGVVNITLSTDVTALSEVVVVGYGTQEKKEITSSVASVKAEDFNRGTVNNPAQLLQGKVAGLSIAAPGNDPNGGFSIRLRGLASFGANTEPLIVIDGLIGGSLSTVDPNDIASIDVLKDASAAAIYGSRGGSGVILITTKTGKSGKFEVTYDGSAAVEGIGRTIKVMTADEYRQAPGAKDFGSSTDWLDEVTQTGYYQVHNMSMSGGAKGTAFRGSFNYRDAQGIAINSGFKQINGRFNLTQKALNDKATITVNLVTTRKEAEFGFLESLRYAIISNPTMPVYDNSLTSETAGGLFGGYAERGIFDYFNPVSIAEQNKSDGNDSRLLASIRGEYDFSDILPGFRASVSYTRQNESDLRQQYFSKTAKWTGYNRNGLANQLTNQRTNQLFETQFNYDKDFGTTTLAVLAGYSYQDFFNKGFGLQGGNFLTDEFTYNNLGTALDFANGLGNVASYANSNKLIGFFGRANLNVGGNYFVSVSARQEGSSRFGANYRWGLFPAASAGVTLSNLIDIPAVNSLKLRASFGVTGNQPADSYISLTRIAQTGTFYYNGTYGPSYGPISNPNPNLKWETKSELDLGADFVMLNNKLTGTFDYFLRNTKDLLLPVAVPVPPNLFGQTLLNIGELETQGLELTLNYQAVKSAKILWTTGINLGTANVKVVSLSSAELGSGIQYRANMGSPGQNATTLVRVKEGDPLGQLWGPVYDGVKVDDPATTADETGTPKFKDLDGNGSYCDCDADRAVVGNGLPKLTFGWTNTLNYGKFDMTMLIRGAIGHDLYNSYRGFYENYEPTTVINYNVVNTKYFDPSIKKATVNSIHVEKADYVKLDNMSIGYSFDMQGKAVNRFRVYAAAQNLFVITGYTGVDPEVRYVDPNDTNPNGFFPGRPDTLSPGVERRNTYFTSRTFTVGVNLGF
jgi:TonB-dependent starch-binding outer membrane protein SusC